VRVMMKKYAVLCCLFLVSCTSSGPGQRPVVLTSAKAMLMLPASLSSQSAVSMERLSGEKMTPTITSLLEHALSQYQQRELDGAGATVERALRITPRAPALWYFLSRIRYVQNNMEQAIQLALRSNSFTKGHSYLMTLNWKTVAAAKRQQGDHAGEQQALGRAQFYESGGAQ